MSERIPQSVTKRVLLKAYLASDHVSDATGKTIAVTISKNGAAFGNPSGGATNATEIANGWYYVDLSTTDTGTAGPLIIRGTATATDNTEIPMVVVDAHNAGFDGVPAVTAGASTGLPLSVDSSGRVDVLKINGTSQTARDIGASVLLSSGTGTGQVSLSSGKVAGVVLVDTLTTYTGNTVQTGDAYARLGAPTGASVSADVAALKTDLDAGVKVSVGTGVGQINASGGKVPATLATSDVTGTLAVNASQIGGSAVSLDTNNLLKVDVEDWKGAAAAAMTGDAYARLGAPAGLTVSADVASVKSDTSGLRTDYTTARAGYLDTLNGLVAAIWASGTRTLTSFGTVASDAATAVWAAGSRTLTAFGFTVTTDVSSTVTSNLDATVSSRLATSGYTAPPTAAQNASAVLTADWSSINGEAARSLLNAARALRNKVVLNAGTITVYKEDGTTVAWTETVTTDPAALPIVSVAP